MRLLHLHSHGDPFTLLEILQTVRDLVAGEQVEIHCDRAESLAELQRLLPSDRCRLEKMTGTDDTPGHRLLVTATVAAATRRDAADNPNLLEKTP